MPSFPSSGTRSTRTESDRRSYGRTGPRLDGDLCMPHARGRGGAAVVGGLRVPAVGGGVARVDGRGRAWAPTARRTDDLERQHHVLWRRRRRDAVVAARLRPRGGHRHALAGDGRRRAVLPADQADPQHVARGQRGRPRARRGRAPGLRGGLAGQRCRAARAHPAGRHRPAARPADRGLVPLVRSTGSPCGARTSGWTRSTTSPVAGGRSSPTTSRRRTGMSSPAGSTRRRASTPSGSSSSRRPSTPSPRRTSSSLRQPSGRS